VQDNPGLVKLPIQSLPQEQQASSHQAPPEQEFDDESEDKDDGEYFFNKTKTTAIQERSIQDIKWGQLDTDKIKYLPR
jgi:hypothetical protein